jgi:hypothetical protein
LYPLTVVIFPPVAVKGTTGVTPALAPDAFPLTPFTLALTVKV